MTAIITFKQIIEYCFGSFALGAASMFIFMAFVVWKDKK